jgi:hypothetical protein
VHEGRSVLVCLGAVSGIRADLDICSEPIRYVGVGVGTGRLREIHLAITVTGRGMPGRTTTLILTEADKNRTAWTVPSSGAVPLPVSRPGRAG